MGRGHFVIGHRHIGVVLPVLWVDGQGGALQIGKGRARQCGGDRLDNMLAYTKQYCGVFISAFGQADPEANGQVRLVPETLQLRQRYGLRDTQGGAFSNGGGDKSVQVERTAVGVGTRVLQPHELLFKGQRPGRHTDAGLSDELVRRQDHAVADPVDGWCG